MEVYCDWDNIFEERPSNDFRDKIQSGVIFEQLTYNDNSTLYQRKTMF